ncbi:hypothetical protein NP233_g1710 [Leucocoprinus birnbaumii]|uniref:Sodium/calcium exchanger membrane region domain-containing protein n=1 Tax=Leucocoprinus birnbaumii TaxID=56174 RepID=A0AAD5W3K2_9AGAR|nr:hypothetical protein NP233_g1710 [Leucocoprinus birnbaumii]
MQPSITTPDGVTRHRIRTSDWSEDELERNGSSSRHPEKPHNPTRLEEGLPPHHIPGVPDRVGIKRFVDRFLRKGKKQIGIGESLYNIATSSFLNLFLVFLPISWVLYFHEEDHYHLIFAFSFLAIMPLERLFDYCGEQMAFYCGKDLSDLIVITLNNIVEATLAIILLIKNQYRILQATIIGVIVLHLLLIPGTAFITGGARIMSQELTPHINELNHTLLTMGVLSIVLPAAFFAALDRGTNASVGAVGEEAVPLLSDEMRGHFLVFSRGIAVILLLLYIASRFYIHDPPGDDNVFQPHAELTEAMRQHEEKLAHEEPEVNQWVNIAVIIVAVGLMAVTAEFLVESTESVTHDLHVPEEWLGLVLLPIVSFAADGAIAILYFFRSIYHHYFRTPIEPISLARARAIDLSVQFGLFWMPAITLIAWWSHKPFILLFDLFEVAVLVSAVFLVNYVTADGKTNWAEGCAMVGFYTMIALCAWFYPGQPEIRLFMQQDTVASAVAALAGGGGGEGGGH